MEWERCGIRKAASKSQLLSCIANSCAREPGKRQINWMRLLAASIGSLKNNVYFHRPYGPVVNFQSLMVPSSLPVA